MNYWVYPGLDHKEKILALNASKSSQVNLNGVLDCCSFVFDASPEELKSPSRLQHLALARHAFVKIVRDRTGMSYESIAEYLGKRNHATAVNSYRQAEALIETDKYFRQNYRKILALMVKVKNVREANELLNLQVI